MNTFPYEKVEEWLENLQFRFKNRNRYLSASIVAVLIDCYIVYAQRHMIHDGLANIFFLCGNGFGIAGAVLIGWGMIVWTTYLGLFDIIGYGVRLTSMAIKEEKLRRAQPKDSLGAGPISNDSNYRSYSIADYRSEKEMRNHTVKHMFIVGAGCFALSVLLCNINF